MKEETTRPQRGTGFSKHRLPIGDQIKHSREDDGIEEACREWQSASLAADDVKHPVTALALQFVKHAQRRLKGHDAASVVGRRQRDTAGTGADIEYSRSGFQFSSRCERVDNSTRQERLVASVIDRGVRREVDSIAQFN